MGPGSSLMPAPDQAEAEKGVRYVTGLKESEQVQLRGILLAEVLGLVTLANTSWLDGLSMVPASRRAEWKAAGRRVNLTLAEQAVLMDQPNPFEPWACDILDRAVRDSVEAALRALFHMPYDFDVAAEYGGESLSVSLTVMVPLGRDCYAIEAGNWCLEDPTEFATLGEVVTLMLRATVAAAAALQRLRSNLALAGVSLDIGSLPVRRAEASDLKVGALAIMALEERGTYLLRVTDVDDSGYSIVVEEVLERPIPAEEEDALDQYGVILDLERDHFTDYWVPNVDL